MFNLFGVSGSTHDLKIGKCHTWDFVTQTHLLFHIEKLAMHLGMRIAKCTALAIRLCTLSYAPLSKSCTRLAECLLYFLVLIQLSVQIVTRTKLS